MANGWNIRAGSGVLTKDGVEMTATAAQLNAGFSISQPAGTVEASKAVVVGANKEIDTIAIADGGLKLGSGAGTAVTSLARELNELDASVKFTRVDDFFGTWLITDAAQGPGDFWSTTAGSGAGTQVATTVANSLNGEVTMKSSTDDGVNSANTTLITGINLGWKANSGGLAIEARLKVDAITVVAIVVGFTDTISTTVELPVYMNAAVSESDADNACAMIFDTDATSDFWTVSGVKATVDTTPVISALAPVAATYTVIRVEVSATGTVTGYVDGVSIGSVANAVTITTALTPFVAVSSRSAAQRILTLDYIKVEQNRIA